MKGALRAKGALRVKDEGRSMPTQMKAEKWMPKKGRNVLGAETAADERIYVRVHVSVRTPAGTERVHVFVCVLALQHCARVHYVMMMMNRNGISFSSYVHTYPGR